MSENDIDSEIDAMLNLEQPDDGSVRATGSSISAEQKLEMWWLAHAFAVQICEAIEEELTAFTQVVDQIER
ncbi:hypothetical protein Aduo_001936 [Ancylostoma duodenale]